MSEFKGTPGPWINVGGWVDSEKSGDFSSIICSIAAVATKNPEAVNDANANLIAAAPDLLEALQSLTVALNRGSSSDVGFAEKMAVDAIKKALGQ